MADVKWSQFPSGNEVKVGDQVVGLRAGANTRFDFPSDGIQDASGNYLFQYETAGAGAVNFPKLINSLTGDAVFYTAAGSDTNVDINVAPKGAGVLYLDDLRWPTADGTSGQIMSTDGNGNLSFINNSAGTPAALTRTNDTNVTVTLGGSPATALLAATSLTMGWTGLLSLARGGTNAATAPAAATNLGLGTGNSPTFTGLNLSGLTVSTLVGTDGSKNLNSITVGSGLSLVGTTLSVSASGGTPLPYTDVTGTTQTMVANNAYGANNVALVTLTLPTTAAVGTEIEVVYVGTGGWLIAQNSGQSIGYGIFTTTIGVGGSLASSAVGNCVVLKCIVANTTWRVKSSQGNLTYV